MSRAITIATYPVKDILPNVDKGATFKITVDGTVYVSKLSSLRLRTFQQNAECVCCGRKGTIMGLDLPVGTEKPHLNLYCQEGNKMIMMTKDHIIAKSKGGKNHISNMQTMCSPCNAKKADKSPEEYAIYLEARKQSQPKRKS